ncbi:MAG TPA: AAA family ATPase [Methanocorpusculum sp.]|nr:AAA family ATPase [Methanocorpusculum sp.]
MTRINRIDIENFRGISKIHYEPKQINVLIGRNNSGKTSILEAIYSNLTGKFGTQTLPDEFIHIDNEIFYRMYDIRIGSPSAHIVSDVHEVSLYHPSASLPENLQYCYNANSFYALTQYYEDSKYQKDTFDDLRDFIQRKIQVSVSTFDKEITYVLDPVQRLDNDEALQREYYTLLSKLVKEGDNKQKAGEGQTKEAEMKFDQLVRGFLPNLQHILNKNVSPSSETVIKVADMRAFDRKTLADEVRLITLENIVKECGIIPNLERLTSGGVVYKGDAGEMYMLPYAMHGNGFFALLRLLYVIHAAKDGVLLIEEPENHMHPGYLNILVEQIMSLSEKLNVQVFISTHSADLIHEFARYPMTDDEENLIQITNVVHRNNEHELNHHSPEEARHTIDELLIDLRGT